MQSTQGMRPFDRKSAEELRTIDEAWHRLPVAAVQRQTTQEPYSSFGDIPTHCNSLDVNRVEDSESIRKGFSQWQKP